MKLRQALVALLLLFGLVLAGPARAISIQVAPASLALSPSGPYTTARDKPVGTILATASSSLTASGVTNLGCAVTALILSGSPASGTIFTTGVSGLGVKLYYYNGATRTQITPGLQVNLLVNLSAPGAITTIDAELVITGPVATGTLSALPSVTVTFAAVGLGCGVLDLGLKTLTVTATNGTVTALSCTVTTPSIAVTLPRVAAATLASAGQTAGDTRFAIGLNCAGAGSDVYVTFTDATNPANTSSNLSLKGTSTATNVVIQLLRENGTAVAYGPDSSAFNNTNQFLIGPSGSVSGLSLTARYRATGAATAGSVNAAATFTMSYQ